ncbi:MAG: hypothetical protein ACXVCY_05160 [Pseudobdellovibrionaceae bacterium]
MPLCFVAQAIVLNLLQKELSGLSPMLALAPVGMAIVTIMIVVIHIIVNADDINFNKLTVKLIVGKIKKWWLS